MTADDLVIQELRTAHADFFAPDVPMHVGRAPGRLDLMGGIADYSGALVLQMPLSVMATVLAQADDAPNVSIRSAQAAALGATAELRIPCATLLPDPPLEYAAARALFADDAQTAWAAYLAGVLAVLWRERGLRPAAGIRLLVHSDVPPGAGVSSSAAIEVACAKAVLGIIGDGRRRSDALVSSRDLALLCQMAENLVVGAPCGVMDQMAVACGAPNALLALRCQPAEIEGLVSLPDDLEVWGINSGVRHAVGGSDYGAVRIGAFMGRRMLQALDAALPPGGYLANVSPSQWATLREYVPEHISGANFLAQYGSHADPITTIDPNQTYAVRVPTEHPIMENFRVTVFCALLAQTTDHGPRTTDHGPRPTLSAVKGTTDHGPHNITSTVPAPTDLDTSTTSSSAVRGRSSSSYQLLGELMYQSHASYSACGLGSDTTDLLVALARQAGPEHGIYGAKITGGGSGGTVAVLAARGSAAAIARIADTYTAQTGRTAQVFGG